MTVNAVEDPGSDFPWHFKKTEDDGIFVKVNNCRLKSSKGELTGKVLKVEVAPQGLSKPSCSNDQDTVIVTCQNLMALSGITKFYFRISKFDCSGSAFASTFDQAKAKNDDFVKKFKSEMEKEKEKKNETGPRKSKLSTPVPIKRKTTKEAKSMDNLNDLISPAKKKKRQENPDDELAGHYLGKYRMKISALSDCPDAWLDRPLDNEAVERLVEKIRNSMHLQGETQPWLAVANISRIDLAQGQSIRDLLPGCNIQVIGGRHRRAAYEKLAKEDPNIVPLLDKVWVSLYDNKMDEEQVRRLAYLHNAIDEGSRKTSWIERVKSCRSWAYKMAGKDSSEPTPESTSEWRKSCQRIYVDSEKDIASLEPTLQAALLQKPAWDLLLKAEKLHNSCQLKDMKTDKPSRRRKVELKQHQLGMPLQGLDDLSKVQLLQQLVDKKISLKELQDTCSSAKKKKRVAEAFMRYTAAKSWEELCARFPNHAKEEKLSQFIGLKIKGKQIPMEMENFFRRAVEFEKNAEQGNRNLRLNAEGEPGVHFFESKGNLGALIPGEFSSINPTAIKRVIPDFKGFALTIVSLPENVNETSLKRFVMSIHSMNVDVLDAYNMVFLLENHKGHDIVRSALKDRMLEVQLAYYVDKAPKERRDDKLLHNIVGLIVIGQWSRFGKLVEANMIVHDGDDVGNVFFSDNSVQRMTEMFSFEGQWVLDVSRLPDGTAMSSIINSGRNCMCLCNEGQIRRCVRKAHELIENVREDDETEDVMTEESFEDRETQDSLLPYADDTDE